MKDENKTKAQLIEELNELRQRVDDQRSVGDGPGRAKRQETRREVHRRLRDAIGQMQSSDDIQHVLSVLKEGLHELEIPFQDCGINLIDSDRGPVVVSINSLDKGEEWKESKTASWGEELIHQFWKEGVPVYRRDLEAEDLYGERQRCLEYFGHPVRCVLDIPFAHGTLAVNSEKPDAFSQRDIGDVEYLSVVLEEGFRRWKDLCNLERHTRELETEITERKRVEEMLYQEKRKLQMILDGIPDVVALQQADHTIISYNKAGYYSGIGLYWTVVWVSFIS